jgi:hypothetical protein
VNGKRIGEAAVIREPFTWDPSQLAIRLGVNYTGLMDELAVFDRVLSEAEIQILMPATQK